MQEMGFFEPAYIGPVWMQINEPKVEDFLRLQALSFPHTICGHGPPHRDGGVHARFQWVFATH
jgi:hypothetical protein